jgi:arylsulfatase A-like enzyme/tetratricopeptide (TPR) repeat protein
MKRASFHRLLCLLLVLAALAIGAFAVLRGQTPRANLLLITLDTVRADHLGAYGYKPGATPALDRLAREGVRFADASTQAPLTGPAHAGILTGVYPTRFGIRDNASTPLPPDAVTLAASLKAAGYRTGAFIAAFILDRAYGFDHGFEEFDSRFDHFESGDKLEAERTADEVLKPALAWLSKLPANHPFFAWVHLYDAHTPYTPPPPYTTRFRTHPYDGEIAYVDSAVGRLIAKLIEKGVLDRTLIVAIGDHGESLGEHGEEEHGLFLYDAVLRIPWIMRLPARAHAGLVVPEQTRAIDLMPTVLDMLAVPLPPRLDGESLAPIISGKRRAAPPPSYAETYYPLLHFGWSALHSLRVGEWKYISAPKPELYDLRRDTSERTNVIERQANVAGRLDGDLRQISSRFGAAAKSAPVVPDADTLARLRSLGYVGFAPSGPAGGGPDPKDMAPKFQAFRRLITDATGDLKRRQPALAIEKLKQALAINERAYDVHLELGDAYMEQRDYDRAAGEYEVAALLNPASVDPPLAAASALMAQGQLAQAQKKIDQAAGLQPQSSELSLARGRLAEQRGRLPQALDEYREAVRRNPSHMRARTRVVNVALQLKQFDAAAAELNALLAAGYEPARTHYGLGRVAESRGDAATAAKEYRLALRIDPTLREARDALARLNR